MLSRSSPFYEKNNSLLVMIVGISVALMIAVWSYYSGQQLLRQQAPLVDSVMQIRLDISEAHELIHEGQELHDSSINKKLVMALVEKINNHIMFLYEGKVQMGEMSATLPEYSALQSALQELQLSIKKLSIYLDSHYHSVIQETDADVVSDEYFAEVAALSRSVDEIVHHHIDQLAERQGNTFGILLLLGVVIVSFLVFLLKRSEQKNSYMLQQSMMLSQALEHSGEAAIIASTDGVIEFVNDAFTLMTGYSAEETLGNNPSMLSSGKQNRPFYQHLWDTISNGKVWRGELTNRKKDGSLYPAIMTIAPILNSEGELTHYIANQRDISDLKALEEHVVQVQKLEAIGTLAGGIAHDFNNSLTAITGNIHLLKKSPVDQENVLKRSSAIQEICDKSASHIRQLLSYARNDSILMDSIELNQSVQNACQIASSMIPSNINLTYVSYDQEVYAHWNETQVHQILINMINNARHALTGVEAPEITLEVKIINNNKSIMRKNYEMTDEQYVCLSVLDNGCGMPEDVMSQIFEPFFTTKEADEGTGLGLSMAYGAVKQIGGCLLVDSRVGVGTRLSMCLPVDYGTQGNEPDRICRSNGAYEGRGELILIADDNSDLLAAQKDSIELFGYTVLAAKNGREAVELFQDSAERVRVVILDPLMPKLSGIEAAKEILDIKPDMNVMFSVADDMGEVLAETGSDSMKTGIPVITKPCSPEVMSQMLYAQMNKKVIRFTQ